MMNTQLSSLTRITYTTAYKCEAPPAMAIFPTAFFFDNLILLLEQKFDTCFKVITPFNASTVLFF